SASSAGRSPGEPRKAASRPLPRRRSSGDPGDHLAFANRLLGRAEDRQHAGNRRVKFESNLLVHDLGDDRAALDPVAVFVQPGRDRTLAVIVPQVVRDPDLGHAAGSNIACTAATIFSALGSTKCSITGVKGTGMSGW